MIDFIYWQDNTMFVGYLADYPDYMTQGETLEELQTNLKDIYQDLRTHFASTARKRGQLTVAP